MEKVGEIILAVDKNSSQRKVWFMALSCQLTDMQKLLSTTCKYIWDYDQCTEIRIGLIHSSEVEGERSVNKTMEGVLKTLGFRWICVNNNN